MWIIIIIKIFLYIYHVSALEVNLARGKRVWEDQPWLGPENWKGDKAVDGRYDDRSAHGGQCMISRNGARTATWRVDLGGVVSISHINIYYRTENEPLLKIPQTDIITSGSTKYTSRMAGFSLYVSNTSLKEDGHLCYHERHTFNLTPSEDQRINCSAHGRYVIYYNERLPNVTYPSYYSEYAYYELCELEVYGCNGNGFYGRNCSNLCPTNCKKNRCDVITGQCIGCVPGYQRPNCSQVCSPHTYGQDCLQSCGNCSNKEICNHVNGMCPHGCNEGVQGGECKTGCKVGRFGKDCKYQCSENCNLTRRCNRFTGECDGGCKSGWTGSMCNQKCPSGSFGMNCLYKCKIYCSGKETCDHVTGVCDEGCKKGWNGPLCNKGILQDILSGFDNVFIWIFIAISVVIVIIGGVLSRICCNRRKVSAVEKRYVQSDILSTKRTEAEIDGEKAAMYVHIDLQEVDGYNNLNGERDSHIYSN